MARALELFAVGLSENEDAFGDEIKRELKESPETIMWTMTGLLVNGVAAVKRLAVELEMDELDVLAELDRPGEDS